MNYTRHERKHTALESSCPELNADDTYAKLPGETSKERERYIRAQRAEAELGELKEREAGGSSEPTNLQLKKSKSQQLKDMVVDPTKKLVKKVSKKFKPDSSGK